MTDEKKPPVKYLSREDLEIVHGILAEKFKDQGEPIPPFSTANESNLDALVKIPQSSYFGQEQYPTLESKVAIIFYTLNKKHIFQNGNKRPSVGCLLVFLSINGIEAKASPDELTQKALWLASTTHTQDFQGIKEDLESWIREKLMGK